MATCPNRKHPDWIKLVSNVGLYGAYSMYTKNNNKTPNVQVDIRLPKDTNKGMSNEKVRNGNKKIKEKKA